MAVLRIIEGRNSAREEFTIDQDRVTIGRGADDDIILPDPSLTHTLVVLTREGGRITALNPRGVRGTGIAVNETVLLEPTVLRHNDILRIQSYLLRFEDPEQTDPKPPASNDARPKSPAGLRVIQGDPAMTGTVFPLDRESSLIGRDPFHSDIIIYHITISRKHARVFRDGGGFFIEDVGSRSRIHVNGTPIDGPTALRDNDVLHLGAFQLVFTAPDEERPDWLRHVRFAPGEPPAAGWPVCLFLHGSGGTGDEHAPDVELAAAVGFAAGAVRGPLEIAPGRWAWPAELDETDLRLTQAVNHLATSAAVDRSAVCLCGFSQGATHVYGLLASGDRYLGGVVLSPGEGPEPPDEVSGGRPRKLAVVFGAQEYPVFRKRARGFLNVWRRAGWPWLGETHPGGHHLPSDWPARLERLLCWLKGSP